MKQQKGALAYTGYARAARSRVITCCGGFSIVPLAIALVVPALLAIRRPISTNDMPLARNRAMSLRAVPPVLLPATPFLLGGLSIVFPVKLKISNAILSQSADANK